MVLDGSQGSEGKVTGWRAESALGTRRSGVETGPEFQRRGQGQRSEVGERRRAAGAVVWERQVCR